MTQRMQMSRGAAAFAAVVVCLSAATLAQAPGAKARYDAALARDAGVRAAIEKAEGPAATELAAQAARVAAAFEALVRRYPSSGYADNALWQGATLAEAAFRKWGREVDADRAVRLYRWLAGEYPHSPLVKRAAARAAQLVELRAAAEAARPTTVAPAPAASAPAGDASTPPAASAAARLRAIERTVLADTVRVTLELDREVRYREERLAGPDRLFFDLQGVEADATLADKVLTYASGPVGTIRVGRHPDRLVRVVLDFDEVARYSVFTLYNPFRLVVDCERRATAAAPPTPAVAPPLAAAPPPVAAAPAAAAAADPSPPAAPPVAAPAAAGTPSPPAANTAGGFSIARQLGLGVSRIVIDPGHGGHDPGAQGKGMDEADLVLDVALRLEKLLRKQAGLEVVLTRRDDVYVPLEERTAMANRESADLFLSIHANASRNTAARGVETYFLSFASSPEAEAVAARENSASGREMHQLPDIIKAIALNNKLDESRDLAGMVQEALVTRLRRANREVRNLGVKKAPFVVLIGAQMPSVLAEISFVTNRQELGLLKTSAYKQRIAEALETAVLRYRRSLKGTAARSDQ